MLISCAVTVQLICIFVFAYSKIRFSCDAAHVLVIPDKHLIKGCDFLTFHNDCILLFSRPVAGYFSICPNSISVSTHKHRELLYTLKHEILHALVGSCMTHLNESSFILKAVRCQ